MYGESSPFPQISGNRRQANLTPPTVFVISKFNGSNKINTCFSCLKFKRMEINLK